MSKKEKPFLVVHLVADESGEKICDLELTEAEAIRLVEYAIKNLLGKMANENKTE
jgi:hypothetical protein